MSPKVTGFSGGNPAGFPQSAESCSAGLEFEIEPRQNLEKLEAYIPFLEKN